MDNALGNNHAPSNQSCYVYFISAGDASIKIGISDNPVKRLRILQVGQSVRLQLVCSFEYSSRHDAVVAESTFHRFYHGNHSHGEWFKLTPKDIAENIDLLKNLTPSLIDVRCDYDLSYRGKNKQPTHKDHQLLGCKLFPDKDADIIGWVNSIPKGEVTEYLKGVIRWWLSGQEPPAPKEQVKVADVRDMFNEMSRKLDELLTRPAVVIGSMAQVQQEVIDDGLSAEDINERMANMASIDFGEWG